MATYTVLDNVLVGISLGVGETEVTIPETENVKAIGAFVFTADKPIVKLTLNSGCVKICDKAFYFCDTLKTITIGSGLEEIEPYAFAGKYPIEEWAGSSTKYTPSGGGLLYDSTGKKVVLGVNKGEVAFAIGTTEIGNRAFSFCDKITSVVLPDSLTIIGDYAFSDCAGLKEITVPSGVQQVGYGAFFGCDSVEVVTLADGVNNLYGLSFSGMPNLAIVKMPSTVTQICSIIGEETFANGGRNVRIDGDYDTVSSEVREHWQGTYGKLPSEITIKFFTDASLGPVYEEVIAPGVSLAQAIAEADDILGEAYDIFGWYYDSSLQNAVDPNVPVSNFRKADDGAIEEVREINLYANYTILIEFSSVYDTELKDGKITLTGVKDWDLLRASGYLIPAQMKDETESQTYEVTGIGDNLFAGASVSSTMSIPYTIRTIGKAAFRGCESLTNIVFEEGSKCGTIGVQAFAGTGLENFVAPDSVKRIRQGAFYGCKNLTTVRLGTNIIGIGNESGNNHGTFEDCDSLSEVRIGSIRQWLGIDFGNSACNPVSNGGALYIGNSENPIDSITAATIGTEVTEIKDFAFVGCSGIQIVDLTGTTVTRVGDEAFSANENLVSVILDNGNVSTIGRASFSNCGGITSVSIPGSLSTIGAFAFNGCENLETINIETGCTSISDSMFSYCPKIEEVFLPASVDYVGNSAFSGDLALKRVEFEQDLHYVILSAYAFYRCTSLGEVVLPVYCGYDENAFANCDHVYSVDGYDGFENLPRVFPDSINSITHIGFSPLVGDLTKELPSSLLELTNLSSITIPDTVTSIGQIFDSLVFIPDTDPPQIRNGLAKEIKPSGEMGPSYYAVDGFIIRRYGTPTSAITTVDLINTTDVATEDPVAIRGICYGVGVFASETFRLPATFMLGEDGAFDTDNKPDWDDIPYEGKPVYVEIADINRYAQGTYTMSEASPIGYGGILIPDGQHIINDGNGNQKLILSSSIRANAFAGCISVTDLILDTTVSYVGDYAFSNASHLKAIMVEGGGIEFSYGAFERCTSLALEGNGVYTKSLAGWCSVSGQGNPLAIAHNLYVYDEIENQYSLLENLDVPSGVEQIGQYSFQGATCLISASIPSTVSVVREYAFLGCSNLTSVLFAEGVKKLEAQSFGGCSSLASIAIPDSMEEIEAGAFLGCDALIDTTTMPNIDMVDGWILQLKSDYEGSLDLDLDPSVGTIRGIGDGAFIEATKITDVIIGSNVQTIGMKAFEGCSRITGLSISEGVKRILDEAFKENSALPAVTIPKSVELIGSQSFISCSSLAEVVIGDGIMSGNCIIGEKAFSECGDWQRIFIGNNVVEIGDYAFEKSERQEGSSGSEVDTTELTIGTRVQTIGKNAFAWGMISVLAIPDSVKRIEEYAFAQNKALETVRIGSGITQLDVGIFYGCESLTEVVVDFAKPPHNYDEMFEGIGAGCKFYFGRGAEGWKDGDEWCGRVFHQMPTA